MANDKYNKIFKNEHELKMFELSVFIDDTLKTVDIEEGTQTSNYQFLQLARAFEDALIADKQIDSRSKDIISNQIEATVKWFSDETGKLY